MAKRTSERQRTIARRLAAAKGAATRRANREGKSPARVWAQLKRSAEKQITRAVNKSQQRHRAARAQQWQQPNAAKAARSAASQKGWATRRANAAAASGAAGGGVGGTDEPVAGASQPQLFPRDDNDYGDPYDDGRYDDYFDGDEEPEY